MDQHGQWNPDILKHMFPQNVTTKILSILPPGGILEDIFFVGQTIKKGEYTVS